MEAMMLSAKIATAPLLTAVLLVNMLWLMLRVHGVAAAQSAVVEA